MPDIFVSRKETEKTEPKINYPSSEVGIELRTHKPSHIRHLATFYERPTGVHFQNQEDDEEILLFLRRHFVTNLPWLFIAFILVFIPLFLAYILPYLGQINVTLPFLPSRYTTIFVIFYYLIVFNYFLINFTTWYFNISLITQKRIVDIDFSDLVYHDIAVTKLSLVEDVNYTRIGFLRSLFDYGDVFVQTAGEKLHFDFLAVPHPEKVVDVTQNLIGKESHVS